MMLKPGNIYSGNKNLAVLTNPTELAFHKGNLKNHYPIYYQGQRWSDLEQAYLAHKENKSFNQRKILMIQLISLKLLTYPKIFWTIHNSGGLDWIQQCCHITSSNSQTWEGNGRDSAFIDCLYLAYEALISIYES